MSAPPVTETDAAIRAAGLRATAPRRAVLDALRVQPHASAEHLLARVLTDVPGTSLQSVYNALGDFVEAGLARRIEPAGRPMLFEVRVDDNHHHLVCTSCGAVEDVDCVVGHAPCLTPSDTRDFVVDIAEITFWGLCGSCAAARSTVHPTTDHTEGTP